MLKIMKKHVENKDQELSVIVLRVHREWREKLDAKKAEYRSTGRFVSLSEIVRELLAPAMK